jgi:hypothetical protein
VRKAFAEKLLWLNGLEVLFLVGSGVGAALIVRQARRQYRDEIVRNMNALLGGKDLPQNQDQVR